jgi:hypothetical protein
VSATQGAQTPIYVSAQRLRMELRRRGFEDFAEFAVGAGTSLPSRKSDLIRPAARRTSWG